MKKYLCLAAILLMLLLTGCQSLSHAFQSDEAGQVAQRFFPELSALPDSVQSDFEHRKTYTLALRYEGYFLKLTFASEAEYQAYLEQTENDYHDMTQEQRAHSYFIVPNARFAVDDYEFRAVDTGGFGNEEGKYIGLIAHCDLNDTVVFLYLWNADASIEAISDGLGEHGYMDFYSDLWKVGTTETEH